MNQHFALDIALLKGEYKAAYVTIMGNVMNSTATIEMREKILTDVLEKLLNAQERGLPAEIIMDDTLRSFLKQSPKEKPNQQLKADISKKNPPFPFFFLSLAITISTIVYMAIYGQELSTLQLNVYPEFIVVPATILVIFLLYYGITIAKLHGYTAMFNICIALVPIYLGIIAYLYITKPLYFCSILGKISVFMIIFTIAILWAITIIIFIRRKKNRRRVK